PARADKILRDADVNPNTAGVKAIGGATLKDAAALEADLAAGALKGLIVLGADAPLSEAALARELDALVAIAAHERGFAARAHVALACAAWAEVHGTITNRQGKVQRLRAAFPPAGQALPAWDIIVRLARKLGAAFDYAGPKAVFTEMKQTVAAFAD